MAYDSTFSFQSYLRVQRSNDMYLEGNILRCSVSAFERRKKESSRHHTHLIYIYQDIAPRRAVVLPLCPCTFLDYTLCI